MEQIETIEEAFYVGEEHEIGLLGLEGSGCRLIKAKSKKDQFEKITQIAESRKIKPFDLRKRRSRINDTVKFRGKTMTRLEAAKILSHECGIEH